MKVRRSRWRRVPLATYRFQFNYEFGFAQALEAIEYLHDLSVSDCYASPLFQARPGSLHGYDVCDFTRLDPGLGTHEEFERFTSRLQSLGMDLLLDVVPNHMGANLTNAWWLDVLENGENSRYACWFDIDWRAPGLEGKVLLPILEDDYPKVLEAGKISLRRENGPLRVVYYDSSFPLCWRSYAQILIDVVESSEELRLPKDVIQKAHSLVNSLSRDAIGRSSAADCSERNGQLDLFVNKNPALRTKLERYLDQLNSPGTASLGQLDAILQQQHYKLVFWRLGAREINYRRFFDISDLISLRMELPEVFNVTHELIRDLIREGKVAGVRIDHPDGLWNPKQYLDRIQRALTDSGPPLFVVVEKILTGDERLPADWPVAGTTGYDFLARLNGLFVNQENEDAFDSLYSDFIGVEADFAEIVYASKKEILLSSFVSEVNALTRRFASLAGSQDVGDFPQEQVKAVLVEVVANFPVYRTYIDDQTRAGREADRDSVVQAIGAATCKAPTLNGRLLRLLGQALLLETEPKGRAGDVDVREFAMRFQQLTGPVMAKGLEDTAFYRFNRLISLNEVGSNPGQFGTPLESFHSFNRFMGEYWPDSLLATSTHDTKRGEDARARINVLSEMPAAWRDALECWRELNRTHKTLIAGRFAPDANDEYFFYQALLGAWSTEAETAAVLEQLSTRMSDYMLKAIREAKIHTSWLEPNALYEQATTRFVEQTLSRPPGGLFLDQFEPFQRKVAFFGRFNSLSQILLKMTAPGVPDFYQGTELWDFNLVDPDNRRPVDYATRRRLLAELKTRCQKDANLGHVATELLQLNDASQLKLFVIWRTLEFRRRNSALFQEGSYIPTTPAGTKHQHICAYARLLNGHGVVVVVPRLVAGLTNGREAPPIGVEAWENTWLPIPNSKQDDEYINVLTNERHPVRGSQPGLPMAEILARFPVALLSLCV